MEILIISGMSGGGKSKAASFLEDVGFYIVDNMPAGMILKLSGVDPDSVENMIKSLGG